MLPEIRKMRAWRGVENMNPWESALKSLNDNGWYTKK